PFSSLDIPSRRLALACTQIDDVFTHILNAKAQGHLRHLRSVAVSHSEMNAIASHVRQTLQHMGLLSELDPAKAFDTVFHAHADLCAHH
ncbi:hypothetical protein SARC_17522, partial [Sphaeroforma arctica JP610]